MIRLAIRLSAEERLREEIRKRRGPSVRKLRTHADLAVDMARGDWPEVGPLFVDQLALEMAGHILDLHELETPANLQQAITRLERCERSTAAAKARELAALARSPVFVASQGSSRAEALAEAVDAFFLAEAREYKALSRTKLRTPFDAVRRNRLIVCGLAMVLAVCVYAGWSKYMARQAAVIHFDLIAASKPPPGFYLEGFGDLEHSSDNRLYRWGMGPQSVVAFKALADQRVTITCAFENSLIDGQGVTLLVNGRQLARAEALSKGTPPTSWEIPVEIEAGDNLITLVYDDWNHNKTSAVPDDSRSFGVVLRSLLVGP